MKKVRQKIEQRRNRQGSRKGKKAAYGKRFANLYQNYNSLFSLKNSQDKHSFPIFINDFNG